MLIRTIIKEMKYYQAALCLLALLATSVTSKLVVYGPQDLIDKFNTQNKQDSKSKYTRPSHHV